MAKIKIKKEEMICTRGTLHKECDSQIKLFKINDQAVLQIDTFGSSTKKETGKISQSIQIDENDILEIIKIYNENIKKN